MRNFRQEGVVAHGLQHPNIVRVHDLDPYADLPYLIMEFVDGPSLRKVLEAHPQGLAIKPAVEIMRGIASGLVCAHATGLIHRDIKPANILIAKPLDRIDEVTAADVKVVDFGLGRTGGMTTSSILQSGSMTTEEGRSIAGTLAYMSPEQKSGGDLDGRSDLYSCGIVLFEMLTGERPAGNELPSSLRDDVPGYLDEVFSRCYTRCERRYATAEEMLDAFSDGAASGGKVPPTSVAPPTTRSGPQTHRVRRMGVPALPGQGAD